MYEGGEGEEDLIAAGDVPDQSKGCEINEIALSKMPALSIKI